MAFWKRAANRIAYLGRRRRFEREMAEEVAFHIETRAVELETEGLGHAAAMARARREFGPSLRVREESRSAWQVQWLEDLAADLRYAARAFRRSPGFAATAIVCLALAVGANTTMFSLAMESLLGAPSCRDPQSLVQLSVGGNGWVLAPQLRYLRDSGALPGVAGINIGIPANWRDGNGSRKIASMHVTDDFFEVTGIPVAAGRPIQRGESHAVVLTDGFWRRMGGDPGSIGRAMTIDGESYTIVGVLPRDHRMLAGWSFSPDLYLSKTLAEYQDRMDFMVYARLPRGMSRQAAYARLAPVCREMDQVFPNPRHAWTRGLRLSSVSGPEQLAGAGAPATPIVAFFAMLVIVTGLVLLIACANVSSLLLARAFSRSHEIAIRMSIGGGRGRIVRQLLAESLLLAVCGTGAGLALDLVLTRLASGFRIPTPLPVEFLIRPEWRLAAYSAAIVFAITLAAGLAPALNGTRHALSGTLKQSAHLAGKRRWGLRGALVAAQIAVSVLLLSGAWVFLRSLLDASSVRPGFDAEHTIVATLKTQPGGYSDERFLALLGDRTGRLRATPGVESVSLASTVPLNPFMALSRTSNEIRPDTGGREIHVQYISNSVGPDYFRVLDIPILRGRPFLETDRAGTPALVILNENLARLLFGNADPLGHAIRFASGGDARVVGVARNSKYIALGEEGVLAMYTPFAQRRGPAPSDELVGRTAHVFLRVHGDPGRFLRGIGRTLSEPDPDIAVEVRAMREAADWALLPSRVGAGVFGATALLGLAIAAIGLYGVLLQTVSRRIPEIGVRLALGATPGRVLWMVACESGRLVVVGAAIGLALAVVAMRPLSRFLVPGVRATDPWNFVAVCCGLAIVAALATLAPAARALRVDPAVALRHE
jgi:predicted permease